MSLHALTKEDLDLYKKTACATKYINVRGLYIDETLNPFEFEEFIDNKEMYFIDSVDLEDVDNELKKVKNDLEKYPRIIAIKIYLVAHAVFLYKSRSSFVNACI